MPGFDESDREHMARALELAGRGRFAAHPNPMVGCIIVRDGQVVGEGWHAAVGEAHAEVNALHAAGDRAKGATAYVTLEPCSHHGKTPPCTDALIAAGVARVVVAVEDPNPEVSGRGLEVLAAVGVEVQSGLMRGQAARMICGFLQRMTRGRPWVRLKVAASLDGRTAMANGQSQWITGPAARRDVQEFRAAAGAVMTGIGTVLADDPSLTVRDKSLDTRGRQPLRVVLDRALRMPLSAEMLALPGQTLVYCTQGARRKPLEAAGATVIRVGERNGLVDIDEVLDDLGAREVNELLVEAGPGLSGSLLDGGYLDELVIYQAPHIMGSETLGMFRTPGWTELSDRRALEIIDVRKVGSDTRITARLTD